MDQSRNEEIRKKTMVTDRAQRMAPWVSHKLDLRLADGHGNPLDTESAKPVAVLKLEKAYV